MKKFYLLLTTTAWSVLSIAQPQLTHANVGFVAGDSYIITNKIVPSWDAGDNGADVTWNFAGLSGGSSTSITCIPYAGAPYAASFPNADLVTSYGSGVYFYSKSNSSVYSNCGIHQGGVNINYSNPEDVLRYPIDYLDSYYDEFSASFFSGVAFQRAGTNNIEADAYGTLILPYGTFTNVMRVHMTEAYTDESSETVLDYSTDIYYYYKTGIHGPLLQLTTLETDFSIQNYYNLLDASSVGVPDIAVENLSVYPNPASDFVTISIPEYRDKGMIEIYDAIGNKVLSQQISPGMTQLSVEQLPVGVYVTKVSGDGFRYTGQLLKQ